MNRKPEKAIQAKVRDLKQTTTLNMGSFVSFLRSVTWHKLEANPRMICLEAGSMRVIRVIAELGLDGYLHSHCQL